VDLRCEKMGVRKGGERMLSDAAQYTFYLLRRAYGRGEDIRESPLGKFLE